MSAACSVGVTMCLSLVPLQHERNPGLGVIVQGSLFTSLGIFRDPERVGRV